MFFKRIREKRIDKIMDAIYKKNIFKRYVMLLAGCLIVIVQYSESKAVKIAC